MKNETDKRLGWVTSSIALGGPNCKLPSVENQKMAGAWPRGSGLPEQTQHHTHGFKTACRFWKDLNLEPTVVLLLTGNGSHPFISCSLLINGPMENQHR